MINKIPCVFESDSTREKRKDAKGSSNCQREGRWSLDGVVSSWKAMNETDRGQDIRKVIREQNPQRSGAITRTRGFPTEVRALFDSRLMEMLWMLS